MHLRLWADDPTQMPSGVNGEYIRLSEDIGVKSIWTDRKYKHPEHMKTSPEWRHANKELRMLKLAESSGFTPIGYEVAIIEWVSHNEKQSCFVPGVIMQHINGTQRCNGVAASRLHRKLFKRTGLLHLDLDENHNILLSKHGRRKRYWIVDFGGVKRSKQYKSMRHYD